MLSPVRDTPISPLAQQPRLNGLGSVAGNQAGEARKPVPATPLSRHRLQCYERWERISRGHQQVLYAQAAEEILLQQWRRMRQLKGLMERALAHGSLERGVDMERLRRQLLAQRGRFAGRDLLDHRLDTVVDQGAASPRLCRLKSVDLLSVRPREEQVEMRIGELWLSLSLPANGTPQGQLRLVQRTLAQCGVEAMVVDGELQLALPEVLWQRLGGQWWMRGQGQRLPAGELRAIRLVELFHWQDPRSWQLDSLEGLQDALPKVQGVSSKLARQLKQVRAAVSQAAERLLVSSVGLEEAELPGQLRALQGLFQPQGFQRRLRSLMAQANTSRNQTQSLLY